MCARIGMELVTFQTKEEQDAFNATHTDTLRSLGYRRFSVGGMTRVGGSTTDWYWTDTNLINANKKIPYPLNWASMQPDNFLSNEYCLNVYIRTADEFDYNDLQCSVDYGTFITNPDDNIYYVCEQVIHNVESIIIET